MTSGDTRDAEQVTAAAEPPSPWRRPEFRKLLAISVTVALGFGMVIPVLPLFAKSFGVGLAAIGLVQLVFGLTRFSSNLAAGLAVDRFGDRAATMAGLLIVSASSYAAGFATTFPQLVVARGFGGAGSALFINGLMSRILRIIEPEAMGRASGAFRSSFLVGTASGPVLGGALAKAYGLTAPLHVYATGLLVATAIAWHVMRGERVERRTDGRSPLEALRAARPLFLDRRYMIALLATFAGWWTISGPAQVVGAVFAAEKVGLSADQVGLAFTLLALGEIAALAVAGRTADRYGRRAVMVPALALTAASTLGIGLSGGAAWAFFAFMVGTGMGVAASGVAAGGLLADAIPKEGSGAAVGLNTMAGDLGYLTAPVMIGALAESRSFPLAYAVAALPAALVFFASLRLPARLNSTRDASPEPFEPVS